MKKLTALNGHNGSSGHKPPRVGSLFAAIGGFCEAFEQVGAKVLWANEKNPLACKTFTAHFPHIRSLHKPVEELTVAGDRLEPVDVLTSDFHCQPFSCAGEKLGFSDERGLLFLHTIRLIREFGKNKPKILLLLENVQNFRSHGKGRSFKRVQTEIQKAEYWFSERNARILNTATHTRIPQNRPRIFMVAMSCDHFPSNTFVFPSELPLNSLNPVPEYLDTDRK